MFSAQDDVTYCWERGGVPPGINLSPTTDAKDKTSYGQVLIVGSVGGGGGFFSAAGTGTDRNSRL